MESIENWRKWVWLSTPKEEPFNRPGDPMDGFTFSSEIYINDAGIEALQQALNTQV